MENDHTCMQKCTCLYKVWTHHLRVDEQYPYYGNIYHATFKQGPLDNVEEKRNMSHLG